MEFLLLKGEYSRNLIIIVTTCLDESRDHCLKQLVYPLHQSTNTTSTYYTHVIIISGADHLATTSDGDTALILATHACCTVKGADPGLLDLLACRGVNVNAQNGKGDSPLSIAAQHGRPELLSILLQYGKKFVFLVHIYTCMQLRSYTSQL